MRSSCVEPPVPEAVCVTGATGYIGSWLVQLLLRHGYVVHATARDSGSGQLKIFRADLNEEGSFDEAVKGCVGVFHVAASMEFSVSVDENIDHVRSQILEPAARGTINLLQACWKARTVRRVVFTSSISTITAKDDKWGWKPEVNESSVNPASLVWNTKPNGWVYVLSKLFTEEIAFQFAKEKGIDIVSIILPTVSGPFLTPNVPASIQVLLSPITGDLKFYPVLVAVHDRLGSIALAHIEDICNAHIFLMENTAAAGRYMCVAGSYTLSQLVETLSSEYPSFSVQRVNAEYPESVPSVICSKRLTELGFGFKYSLRDIIKQSVASCTECGFLARL